MDQRLNVLIPDWLREQVASKAQRDATTVSVVVRRLVWAWVNGQVNVYNLPDPPDQPAR